MSRHAKHESVLDRSATATMSADAATVIAAWAMDIFLMTAMYSAESAIFIFRANANCQTGKA